MRITYLLTWGDAMGGTERAVFTQAAALADRHEVTVIGMLRTGQQAFPDPPGVRRLDLLDSTGETPTLLDDRTALDADQVETLASQPSDLVDPRWERAFSGLSDHLFGRLLPTIDADVVVTTTPALLAVAARLLPDRVALVHQEHRTSELRTGTMGPLLAYGPAADLVVFLTAPTQAYFQRAWGSGGPRTDVIGNALAPDVRPRSARADDLIVCAARLVPSKQPDHVVAAFCQAAPGHPTWRLRLLGDGPMAPRLRRMARDAGLADRVELLGRTRSMALQWASASIGALASRAEGYPLVIAEAYAAGVPFVSYDCPHGPRQIIQDDVDGLLVPDGDIGALATTLDRLMGNRDLQSRLAGAAYARSADFTPRRVADSWDAALREVTAGRPGRPARATRIRPLPDNPAARD
jgi:glycosyltransferase involved in cell wall biosynthesis